MKYPTIITAICAPLAAIALSSCGERGGNKTTIQTAGSTTLMPIVTAWAEAYAAVNKNANVTVSGGGSGVGINELIEGRIDIANASRPMKDEEKEKVKAKFGKDVTEIAVGLDALAVFVHKDNPVKEISIDQLKGIYSAGGTTTTWDAIPGGMTGDIRVLGRESNSGTGEYFKEAVCGKGPDGKYNEFREGIAEMNSSQAVIDTLASTKNAIAYDGMAFKTDAVSWLAISKTTGEKAVTPSVDDAKSGAYPLSRKLYFYTIGEPTGETKNFVDWVLSAEGQKIVAKVGAVPIN
ncbi:MAG: phosphate ABC transporter substrate-binding protein [Verrucomicrobiales bacterium]